MIAYCVHNALTKAYLGRLLARNDAEAEKRARGMWPRVSKFTIRKV